MAKWTPIAGNIAAGAVGGALFVLFAFGLQFNLVLAAALSVGGYVAAMLIFAPSKTPAVRMQAAGLTQEMVDEALRDGRAKLSELRRQADRIPAVSVKRKVQDIAGLVERILDDIRRDPKDLRSARQFMGYYLDATTKIVGKYVEISERDVSSTEIDASLRRVEGTLDTIKGAFQRQLARLLEDDVMDLDTEVELLEKTIEMEGFGKDEG